MNKVSLKIAAALAAVAVTSCSQSNFQPDVKTVVNPISQSTLQFAVGTANVAGTVGLNTVVTLRQNSGASTGASVLANAPSITGPAGFVVPAAPDSYLDAETSSITGSLQTNLTVPPKATTFDPSYGVQGNGSFAYNGIASSLGFLPAFLGNASLKPNLFPYALPFYANQNPALVAAAAPSLCTAHQATAFNTDNTGAAIHGGQDYQLCYVGGPPSFVTAGHTSTQDGTFPTTAAGGFPGYELGFTDFQAAPVAGTYTLNVTIPTGVNTTNGGSGFGTKTATASLASTTALPGWTTAPTFTTDGTGGGTVATNFGTSAGVTEEYLEVVDQGPGSCQGSGAAPFFYTLKVTPGTATVAVPDNIGAAPPGKAQGHTFCTAAENTAAAGMATPGDTVAVYGFGADYGLFASAFPQSAGQVTPTITGAGGQADITTSVASLSAE